MEEMNQELEGKILTEYRENKRGYLNKLRGKAYSHIKQYLWDRFPMLQDEKYSFGMRLYWLENGIDDFPTCTWTKDGEHANMTPRCRINGYETEYCSEECAHKAGAKKGELTKLEKYGDRHWHNPEKTKRTNLERYGCENPFANPDIAKMIQHKRKRKSKQLMKKAWETRRKNDPIGSTRKFYELGIPRTYKYASDFPKEADQLFLEWLDWSGIKDFEVRRYTKKERAGIRLKFKQYKKLQLNSFKPDFTLEQWIACEDPWEQKLNWICPAGHHFEDHFKTHYGLEHLRCPICNPYLDVGTSQIEKEMIAFIEEQLGHDCIKNSREIIAPLELDAYVPENKIAFEMDGLYQHSDACKKPRYHLLKTNMCKKHSIQLVHIFEDEWKNKQEICKSCIKQALGLNLRIDASELRIKKISQKDAAEFFKSNCIHYVDMHRELTSYGIFDGDKLLFACSFAHLKANKYEIIGFCDLLGHDVLGAIDAVCERFKCEHLSSYIRCKVDRRFYSELNFHDCKTFQTQYLEKIGFYYVNYGSDFKLRDWQINENFLKAQKQYDQSNTLDENLTANKFSKIYDSGQIVFTWKK